ncbi:MAG: cytochrome c biogenesis protein CcsA [Verrucomicrobiota bacterium]
MDRLLLTGATFCLLLSFGYTLYALGAGRFRPGAVNLVAILGGFLILTADLWIRGRAQGSCPINSLFDVLVFMCWSILLIYLVIGPAYHLSLLGAFTSPLVFLVLLFAQLGPVGPAAQGRFDHDPWTELHAALSLVAYGAFALAAVAGLMYLVQDRQLKMRRTGALLYNLPPISDLGVANARLIKLGFGLLTAGFVAGFAAGHVGGVHTNGIKFLASVLIWAGYGAILLLRKIRRLPPKRTAEASMLVFCVALLALPAIQYLSSHK